MSMALACMFMSACQNRVANQYIDEIEKATQRIEKATSYDDIKEATKALIDFEREHKNALNAELKDNKVKQAEVDKAYKEFMQKGMSRSFDLGSKSFE